MENKTLNILTYNVLFGPADGELLRANRRSMEILKSLINLDKQNSIDVICFQEFWDSICEDYGALIQRSLLFPSLCRPVHKGWGGVAGWSF